MSCTHHSLAVRNPAAHPPRPSRPSRPTRPLPSTCCRPAGAAAAVGAVALASPRGFGGLQFGSLLLGAWLIISPVVLDQKFRIAHPMYWSNSWSGGVLIALALAGLAALRRPAR